MRLIRTLPVLVAVGAALVLAAPVASSAATKPANLYLYIGSGTKIQIKPQVLSTSVGTIKLLTGQPMPPGPGRPATYPGWHWSLTPTAASALFANLSGKVVGDLIGAGWAPLSGEYAGSFYFKCLTYLTDPNVTSAQAWLRWDAAAHTWKKFTYNSTTYGEYCENQQ
jgi:hypothetical protein